MSGYLPIREQKSQDYINSTAIVHFIVLFTSNPVALKHPLYARSHHRPVEGDSAADVPRHRRQRCALRVGPKVVRAAQVWCVARSSHSNRSTITHLIVRHQNTLTHHPHTPRHPPHTLVHRWSSKGDAAVIPQHAALGVRRGAGPHPGVPRRGAPAAARRRRPQGVTALSGCVLVFCWSDIFIFYFQIGELQFVGIAPATYLAGALCSRAT